MNESIGSIKKELMYLQTLRLESRKLKRESDVVDLAVQRHTEQVRQEKSWMERLKNTKRRTNKKTDRQTKRQTNIKLYR